MAPRLVGARVVEAEATGTAGVPAGRSATSATFPAPGVDDRIATALEV